jgi:aminopeptidase N
MSSAVVPSLTLLLAQSPIAQETELPSDGSGWRWKTLELDVWIDTDLRKIHLEGHGSLVLQADSSDGPLLEIDGTLFEFYRVGAEGALETLGERLAGQRPMATARLHCAEVRARGSEIDVEFECDSKASSGQLDVTQEAALASWTQAWYPHPFGDQADLSRRMAASGLTRFHLPPGWQSVSNGEPEPTTEPDVEIWRVSKSVARSFACAPYTSVTLDVDGRPIGVHRLRSAKEPADVELRAIAEILRTLEGRYGPYPYPGYRVAEVPLGVGNFVGSSEQGFIMVRPVAFDAPDGNLALFAHELAHGWWGNQVTTFGDGARMLDEALAQYSAVVAIEAIEGEAGATELLRFSRPGYIPEQCARGYFQTWRDGQDSPLSSESEQSHQLADSKGMWVYHMLRERVGSDRFFATLRGILQEFREKPLTLPELRSRFESAAPDANLSRFFSQWLDRTGTPILECTWQAEGDDARVRIRQVQPGDLYSLVLDVAVDSSSGRRVHTVEIDQRETSLELSSEALPTGVELDPNHKLLMWTEDYGSRPVAALAKDG